MQVTMIGTGYVGLVSGACFSEFGVDVTCVDKDRSKIDKLLAGEIPIFEPGLDRLVANNRKAGRLHFTTDLKDAVEDADVVFIAVGTPEQEDGSANLDYVFSAADEIAEAMRGYTVVVTKSTVPVGTGEQVRKRILAKNPDAEFDMASNPEFLREGSAIEDFMRPNRVVIGAHAKRAIKRMKELYRPLYLIEAPVLVTSIPAAELTKYAANAFLAVKITFANQIANLCEAVGADVHDVVRGMGLDNRIGRKFLHPGPGYGGSCFPKDTQALARTARENHEPVTLVEAVLEANDAQKLRMVDKIEAALGGSVEGMRIGVLGLTFKPNTDDMRDAPSLTIIPSLQKMGAEVIAYDPEGMEAATRMLEEVTFVESAYEACEEVDALVILTEWNQFRFMNLKRVKQAMRSREDGRYVFCDFRNIYEPDVMKKAGFRYTGVGR
ncbi:MAG: UDP-glucose/GDP-mannose dehydrogenase family protein [Magnetococcales bacterium]|nr:UDP-glucose/GDP-mannose dehydrogenase family protein [Magnetococcales bacterium]